MEKAPYSNIDGIVMAESKGRKRVDIAESSIGGLRTLLERGDTEWKKYDEKVQQQLKRLEEWLEGKNSNPTLKLMQAVLGEDIVINDLNTVYREELGLLKDAKKLPWNFDKAMEMIDEIMPEAEFGDMEELSLSFERGLKDVADSGKDRRIVTKIWLALVRVATCGQKDDKWLLDQMEKRMLGWRIEKKVAKLHRPINPSILSPEMVDAVFDMLLDGADDADEEAEGD